MTAIRVRFAPSPSGFLHVGGARTALHNWLFAKQAGGSCVLRIEDTDQSRSTDEAIAAITESLAWLGLAWDEGPGAEGSFGPYRQSERGERYRRAAQVLIDGGRAYHCYCSQEELKEERRRQREAGKPPRYSRRCYGLDEHQAARFRDEGRKPTVRFKAPESGATVVKDLVRGNVTFENRDFGDFILVRSDGSPTYNLAVVVDDHEMRISHVLRGEDHLSNTPKQLLLFEGLGWRPPAYGHLPMIVGADRTPLSKRHGSVAVSEFRKQGYLPETLLNFLALLGWSYDDAQVLFDRDELIDKFSLERVIKSAALFDQEKLDWMNGVYIREMPVEELAGRIRRYLAEEKGLAGVDRFPAEWWVRFTEIVRERISTLAEVQSLADFFFYDELGYDEKAAKALGKDGVAAVLEAVRERLAETSDFSAGSVESVLRKAVEELGLKPRKLFQPVRAAVTGRMVSPPLFESIELLGKRRALAFLEASIGKARK